MKHAAVLYTCIGLMGAAAVTGFADYTHANKAGLLKDLYTGETATQAFFQKKEIVLEDYSRGAIGQQITMQDQLETDTVVPPKRDPKKPAIPSVPTKPPKPKKIMRNFTPPPPPPEPEMPPAPPAPTKQEKFIAPPPPPTPEPPMVEKEALYEKFSRAPLKKRTLKKKKP